MKYSYSLPATAIAILAASFSFNAISSDNSVIESSTVQVKEPHDQVASLNSILDFKESSKNENTASAYGGCSPTTYTRYTSLKLGQTKTIASFTYNGGGCNRYDFSIMRNWEGQDFKVTLVDTNGDRVAGGYSVSVSTSIFESGTYYWQVENQSLTGATYGGISYEVRSGG